VWESEVLTDVAKCVAMILDSQPNISQPNQALSIVPSKTFAEFFAGIGLMRCALEKHGWRAAYANDIDPRKQEMYRAHFGAEVDVRGLRDIPRRSSPSVRLATALFPCNPLS